MAKLDLIGIVTEDIARSVAFYRVLGWEIPEPPAGEDHYEITLPNGLRIAWDTVELVKQFMKDWQPPTGHRMGMAFLCANPAEVDALYERALQAGAGASLAPFDAFWGQRYAQVKDPDGNTVDLFAPI